MSSSPTRNSSPDESLVRAEVERVLASKAFRQAPRQSELLTYIADATLSGRKGDLVGKNIAENVFDIDPTSPRDVSTVRVEIGRLRRRLSRYYAGKGATNPARIEIPKGEYSLSFRVVSTETSQRPMQNMGPLGYVAVAGVVITVAAVGLILYDRDRNIELNAHTPRFTESAEAYSLFYEARNIGNPPTNRARVQTAIELAKEIQRIDSDFGGGYAEESLQMWNYVLFGHSDSPVADTERALNLARKAIETDPEFSWGQHALAQALHLSRDAAGAVEAAYRAVDLDHREPDHHGYLGLFLALSGRSSEGIDQVKTALELLDDSRVPYRNFLGIAYFHDRQFAEAAEAIEESRRIGGPSGPHMLTYLAAAHALAGNEGQATAIASLIRNDNSNFVPANFINRLLEDPMEHALLLGGLEKAGLYTEDLKGNHK